MMMNAAHYWASSLLQHINAAMPATILGSSWWNNRTENIKKMAWFSFNGTQNVAFYGQRSTSFG
jgi:hypothetical protein